MDRWEGGGHSGLGGHTLIPIRGNWELQGFKVIGELQEGDGFLTVSTFWLDDTSSSKEAGFDLVTTLQWCRARSNEQ